MTILDHKILLLGSNGQIGSNFLNIVDEKINLFHPSKKEFNKDKISSLIDLFEMIKPSIIINTIAFTNVELAEKKREYADYLNHQFPEAIANWCIRNKSFLIHYSSDYVYNIESNKPIYEDQEFCPINVYGKTKAQGDQAIIKSGCNSIILRCSWVYSFTHISFLQKLIQKIKNQKTIHVVDDQIGTPTPASWIATITLDLIKLNKLNKGCNVINCVPSGYVSWYGFAKQIFMLLKNYDSMIEEKEFIPVNTNSYQLFAPRPLNSRLSNIKLKRTIDKGLPSWEKLLLKEIKAYYN